MKNIKKIFGNKSKSCQTCGKALDKSDKDYCEDHLPLKKSGNLKLSDSSNNYDKPNQNGNSTTNDTKAIPTPSTSEIEDKVTQLQSMFDSINQEAIRVCLRDNNYNMERAIDTLLNLTALLPNRQTRPSATSSPPRPEPSNYATFNQIAASNEEQLMNYVQTSNINALDAFLAQNAKLPPNTNSKLLHSLVLLAIQSGNVPVMSLLLEKGGISANGEESMVYTPLLLAIEARSLECAIALLDKHNADPNKSNASYTPIFLASKLGDAQVVKHLIKKGANVNSVDKDTGKTPLHEALLNKHSEICTMILDTGNAGLSIRDLNLGETPLHLAVRSISTTQDILLCSQILDKSDNSVLNTQDKNGNTILHISAIRSISPKASTALMETIITYKVDPTIKNKQNKTALDIVVTGDNTKLTDMVRRYTLGYMSALSPSSPVKSPPRVEDTERKMKQLVVTPTEIDCPLPIEQADTDWKYVNNLYKHIEKLIGDDWEVSVEFGEIENTTSDANLVGDFTSSLQPYNLFKNRYRNILPYEHSRVKLNEIEGIIGSDFISGNWISGEISGSEKSYIATQGPLQQTVEDFWRMVQEHNVKVVVMLSNLMENGREKVWQYWPESEELVTSVHKLSLVHYNKTDQLISREIQVENLATKQRSIVTQLQYIAWPDHGLPEHTDGFTKILDLVDAKNASKSPIVVHCSAGIGRTGTFCIAHGNLWKLRLSLWASLDEEFDLKKGTLRIRQQRAGMIQTKEQYLFCYLALRDWIPRFLKLIAYKNQKWFHKNVKSDSQAQELLKGKPSGSFLVRPSTEQGKILITFVNESAIVHHHVNVNDNGFIYNNKFYQSFVEILKGNPQVFRYPLYK